jgi:hypothetical protein
VGRGGGGGRRGSFGHLPDGPFSPDDGLMHEPTGTAILPFGPGDAAVFRLALAAALKGYENPEEITESIRRADLSAILHPEERAGLTSARRATLARLAIDWKRADEAAWVAVTDNERLSAAFALLEARGLICRENYLCCSTCARTEMEDEISFQQEEGKSPRGYAFFHDQDLADACLWGRALKIVCGPADWKAADAETIGSEVREGLERAGLSVRERFVSSTPIKLFDVDLVWRKRMPGR